MLQRAHVTADREGDVFIAVLVVFKAKRSDTGRYTCHPVGVDPIELTTQFESFPSIHIFISCIYLMIQFPVRKHLMMSRLQGKEWSVCK